MPRHVAGEHPGPEPARRDGGGVTMADIVFVIAAVAFFAVSAWYVRGCDKL
jgi:hypothetical protein